MLIPLASLMSQREPLSLTESIPVCFFILRFLFIYFLLHWILVAAQGLSQTVVLRFLLMVASLVEHRL